jgi:uncharacterized protein YjbJ (UPF0337 family)
MTLARVGPGGPVSASLNPNIKEFSHGLERVEGNWKQVKGKVKEQWGKLTDDDLDVIGGRRDQLEGKIQEVRRDVDDWYTRQRW